MAENEQSIGTARVDVVVNTSTWQGTIDSAKSKVAELGPAAEAAYAKVDTAQKRVIDSALKQTNAIGKTRQELIQMKLDAAGVPTAVMDAFKTKLEATAAAAESAGHGVEEFSLNNLNARRELGRLASDLANGNYGRFQQTAMTLANYSGLMGAAFSLAGAAVLGTVGAIGAFIVAAVQGSAETTAYNQALITTGNYAGKTADQLERLAKGMPGPQNAAAAIVAAVAGSGKFNGDQIATVSQAAQDNLKITGQAVDATIKQFESLATDPVTAILALNDAQHFLSTSTYEQIKALEDQGKEQDASTLAMKTYADALATRTTEVVANTGLIEKAWKGVVGAAKSAWDAMLGVGRDMTDSEKLAAIQAQLAIEAGTHFGQPKPLATYNAKTSSYESTGAGAMFGHDPVQDQINQAKALQDKINAGVTKVQQDALSDRLVEDESESDQEVKQYSSNAQKRAAAMLAAQGKVNAQVADAFKAGNIALAAHLLDNEKLIEAGINDKYKDPKVPKPRSDPFADLNGLVQKAQVQDNNFGLGDNKQSEQVTQILAIADAGAKLIKSGHDVATVQAEVATGVAAVNDLFAKQAEQLTAKNDAAYKEYTATLDKADDALQRQVQNNVLRLSMGDKEYQQLSQINQITQQGIEAVQKLQAERDGVLAKNGDTSLLDREIAARQADTDKQVAIVRAGFTQMDAAQADWKNGAIAAMQDYADQGANVAGQTKTLFTNMFDSLNTAVLNFATTGKFNFKSFASSVLTDLAKMELRIAESKILQAIIGTFTSSGNDGTYTGVGGANSGFTYNAKGGVYDSPSLSAYSNQVVTKPTRFAFAMGAGLMGEAGPEAILPLQRDSQGRLGVKAGGMGGGGNVIQLSSTFNIDASGSKQTASPEAQNAAAGQLKKLVDQAANDVLRKAMRPGGAIWKMQVGG